MYEHPFSTSTHRETNEARKHKAEDSNKVSSNSLYAVMQRLGFFFVLVAPRLDFLVAPPDMEGQGSRVVFAVDETMPAMGEEISCWAVDIVAI